MKKFLLFAGGFIVLIIIAEWIYLPYALEKIETNLVESVEKRDSH
jgi:hypothetical protein